MAETRCAATRLSTESWAVAGRIQTSGAAPDLTPKPLLNTPIERSIQVKNSPTQPSPRTFPGGVA